MKKVNQLIVDIKSGYQNEFGELLQKFMPLINKYARLLYKDEQEDMKSELSLALWESINKMKYYDNEEKCIAYIKKSIFIKYLELYRKSRLYFDHIEILEDKFFESYNSESNTYSEIEISNDLNHIISKYSGQTYNIFYSILFEQLSDSEIARKYNISRQYSNRKRRELIKLLQEQYK